jgi:hypothetical protein
MKKLILIASLLVAAGVAYAAAPTTALLRALRSMPTGDGGFRTLTITPGRWAVPAPVTIPANVAVEVQAGAKFVASNGATLDFAGPFEAPPVPIFEGFAVGAVTFSGGATIRSEWWVGSPDGGYATAAATGTAGELTLQGALSATNFGPIYTDAGIAARQVTTTKVCIGSDCTRYLYNAGGPNVDFVIGGSAAWDFGGVLWTLGGAGLQCNYNCPPTSAIPITNGSGGPCLLLIRGGQIVSHNCPTIDGGL